VCGGGGGGAPLDANVRGEMVSRSGNGQFHGHVSLDQARPG